MNNPPAFPSSNEVTLNDWVSSGHSGMTLRDYFAAKAMQTILAAGGVIDHEYFWENAQLAYKQADEMLNAREA
jgi:hypothetical protein